MTSTLVIGQALNWLKDVPEVTYYKGSVLIATGVVFGWEFYLSFRQHLKLHSNTLPAPLKGVVKMEDFKKAQAYGLDKSRFAFFSSLFSQALNAFVLVYNILPLYWSAAGWMCTSWVGWDLAGAEIGQSLFFSLILYVQSTLVSIPFDLYSTFVIEERHGFNKQTLQLFITDIVKSFVIACLVITPLVSALINIIKWAGDQFYWYVWAFMFLFQLTMLLLYPTVIQPLFNTFKPLEDGSLKTKIEALATRIAFPLTKLFVVDGSKRSGHSNAYFYGFFKNKRIVLYDTLLDHSTEEEVCGVLAHELGHWKKNHVFKMLAINQLHLLAIFYTFGFFIHSQELYESFGFDSRPILIGFFLFNYILTPAESVMGFMMNLLSRLHEFQADDFAKSLGYAESLASGLVKLHVKNLGNLNPDKLYSIWNYSHPPLVERLAAIKGKAGKKETKKKA